MGALQAESQFPDNQLIWQVVQHWRMADVIQSRDNPEALETLRRCERCQNPGRWILEDQLRIFQELRPRCRIRFRQMP